MNDPRDYATPDERTLREVRQLAPTHPIGPLMRLRWTIGGWDWAYRRRWGNVDPCAYCTRVARRKFLVTNPLSLQRQYYVVCRRKRCLAALRRWEATADARRRRAQYDWERQHEDVAALLLIGSIPPQYPSVSRATLRAFLDSGADVATVGARSPDPMARALNSSIRTLGFGGRVFAEIRDGQAVLRRVPQ
jgi:hypothetical protein